MLGGAVAGLESCSMIFGPKAVVASKPGAEQVILGELIAQHLERTIRARAGRKFELGDTNTMHRGILNGELDVYAEYSGEAILNVLNEQPSADADRLWERVRGEYLRVYKLEYFSPLGINNRFAISIPAKLAAEKNLKTLSDAAALSGMQWSLSCTRDFMDRREGHATLMSNYHLDVSKAPNVVEPDRVYRVMDDGIVTMAAGNETDGLLSTGQYVTLADDKSAFVHWQPCVVARKDMLDSVSGMRDALRRLSGKITNAEMRRLCFLVDVERVEPKIVVSDWLKTKTF